jgi:hypothetical protein
MNSEIGVNVSFCQETGVKFTGAETGRAVIYAPGVLVIEA